MSKHRFEQRCIAFVDILGFRNIVERMSREDRLFTTVRDALKGLDRQSRDFQHYRRERRKKREETVRQGRVPLDVSHSNLQMTAFSDCYVLSEVSPTWHVLAAVQALGSHFLTEGILTRGAVVQGNAYHNGRVLFGPGIVQAYTLESEVAIYPRILVTEQVRQEIWGYHEGLWKGRLLKHDVDGCWFVNLLTPSLSSWTPLSDLAAQKDLRAHLKRVRQSLVGAWKQALGHAGHMSKVGWLIHRFNKAAEEEGLDRIDIGRSR
jgi:hypothetical protein